MLTAAHVVAGAVQVSVRDLRKRRLSCRPLDPAFVGHPTNLLAGPDLALLEIDDAEVDLPPIGLARIDRDSDTGESVDRCHAWGYPEFSERARPDGSGGTVRESCDAAGVIPVGSGLVSGLLDLQVMVAPRPYRNKTSRSRNRRGRGSPAVRSSPAGGWSGSSPSTPRGQVPAPSQRHR